ncbi:MAG: hypothetical protein JRJ66_13780 [Deltaproteobacteria bacterium]|nr:hypothetical protein [Deltaproteobacteria bacterium]MBW1976001.1 hypothetical protein [Deltaproteobacteria bacterium]
MAESSHDKEMIDPIQMDETVKVVLRSNEGVPPEIEVRGRKYYPKEYKGEGFKGVVWRGKDEYEGDVAIKFTIFADYMEKSYLEEAKRARKLGSSDNFARFLDAGVSELPWVDGGKRKFIVFVEQWISGTTLSTFVKEGGVTPIFFLGYVRGICGALGVLTTMGYRHDDLRPENVMIEEPEKGDVVQEAKVKVIDTGSMKLASVPTRKPKDDYRWFAEHLLLIRNALYQRKPLSLHEARFIKEIDPLLDRMFEEDRGAALWAPSRVYAEFESAWTRAQGPTRKQTVRLSNPFDYIAAEHIVSDELLVRLFADSCPWFAEVAGPNPVLLTGPRGCGKSMVFRRLSLKVLLYKTPKEIEDSQIAGFYVSCSSDLRNRVGWLNSERIAGRFRNEIVHYFNLLIAREIIQTLAMIARREDRTSLFGFGLAEETSFHQFLMEQLQVSEPHQLRLQGMSRMEHALGIIEHKMDECYKAMRRGITAVRSTDTPFLADLAGFLSKQVQYFQYRKIALLIDDFSVHRLPRPVQAILNLVLWDRQGRYVSKVSAEKYGSEAIDQLKGTSEISRELRELDCGRYYLETIEADTRRFAKDLLAIRLGLAEYQGTPDQLIGHSKYEKGGLGQALRVKKEAPGRKNDQYHGIETIAAICSGDIANLLEIYRRIFEYGKVTANSIDPVPAHIQHKAIQAVSRDLLELIKNYTPLGLEMYNVVSHFGVLSRRVLCEAPEMKKGPDKVPPQTTRIEVDQPPDQPADEMAPSQKELMRELVRRTIFIEMSPGRTRHGFTLTLRWQLRRIYCPSFGTTVYKNTAIKWRLDEFKRFLLDPKTTCEDEFKKRWARPERCNGNLPLFSKGGDHDSFE